MLQRRTASRPGSQRVKFPDSSTPFVAAERYERRTARGPRVWLQIPAASTETRPADALLPVPACPHDRRRTVPSGAPTFQKIDWDRAATLRTAQTDAPPRGRVRRAAAVK